MPELTTTHLSPMEVSYQLDPQQDRSPGYHVTDLIESSLKRIGKGYRGAGNENLMAMGRMWEWMSRWVIQGWAKDRGYYCSFSEEHERDGITGSLDGVLSLPGFRPISEGDPDPVGVIEAKMQFKPPSDPTDNFRWMSQIKAYCHMLGVNWAVMPVLSIATKPPDCWVTIHELTFKDLELAENWQMITNEKREREKVSLAAEKGDLGI